MTEYYTIEPEVAGQFGEKTEMDRSVHPPDVTKLHYEFHGWLGDDLLTTVSNFVISEELKNTLSSSDLSGYEIDDVTISKSPQFEELHPDMELPEFYWMQIVGDAGQDDFGISDNNRLIISREALDLLETVSIEQAEVKEFDRENNR
ncbi:hypothetical protein GL213_08730 [Halogeometricum borinquense]|uniref:Uncharacterized protein n=1 Tax=Halogeometricum borinquense TaxID=60847 RepID=A0A6C0UFG9_9EURY|nr:hypothetical protein [Halogeometricum borinquense]QIB74196.1 hypothetical protein G3I44_07745 [Halogeometricum borinquense]QIQ76599.1 hypothetical protein GL213_08730 [Halogeometricum borinquense]